MSDNAKSSDCAGMTASAVSDGRLSPLDVIREAYARLDRYLARDDDPETEWLDPHRTLLDIEELLHAALPQGEQDDTPVGATEDMEYDDAEV